MAITQGMVGSPVYGEDGTHLGTVKEVRGDSFKVNAQMQPDYWLRAAPSGPRTTAGSS